MNKAYHTNVSNEYEARQFIDWLLEIPTPCEVVLNSRTHYKFDNNTDKLYFLTAFEAILNIDT
jgi:hypothetical protein